MAVWRRRALPIGAVVAVGVNVYLALGFPLGPLLLAEAVAVFAVVCAEPARRALPAVGAVLVVAAAALVVRMVAQPDQGPDAIWTVFARMAGFLLVPAVCGILLRLWRDAAARARVAAARVAAAQERLRVAQDVHDIVGHGLAVIAMQSGIALHGLDRDPGNAGAARRALEAVRTVSTRALGDLRAELDLLRTPSADGPDGLDGLLERVRSSGLAVTLHADPEFYTLPGELARVVNRIVQEALTNVRRHAGPDVTASVEIRCDTTTVRIQVLDSGAVNDDSGDREAVGSAPVPGGAPIAGNGLRGVRRRVEALGGRFSAGAQPTGGFGVHADIPIMPAAS
ncbi:sensor histidine kinase [Nocardia crassostreae]|uniref:sensor histidine kinase n=1 Tax=Nocardia crassostreae TaxID=53428 RepID=UPI00082DAC5E|nr:histidine kinase [Nocardia crassostreae]